MLDFEKEALEIYNRGEHLKQGGEISLESKRTLSSLLFEEESAEPSGDSAEIDLDNFSLIPEKFIAHASPSEQSLSSLQICYIY